MTTQEQREVLFNTSTVLGIEESELELLYHSDDSTPHGARQTATGKEWVFVDTLIGVQEV